jgi:hypothetical protein
MHKKIKIQIEFQIFNMTLMYSRANLKLDRKRYLNEIFVHLFIHTGLEAKSRCPALGLKMKF